MTTTIDPTVRLGELVTERPPTARVLERHHLDYCCHGQITLGEACAAAGLAVDQVLDELAAVAAAPAPQPWTTMGPTELADLIEATHHRFLREELPRLTELGTKVVGVHGERHPELADVARCLAALRADLEPHLMKEERVLFPIIRQLEADRTAGTTSAFHCGSVQNPIGVMLLEHDAAGHLLERLRRLTGDYRLPDDACASYALWYRGLEELEHDTHQHVHKENHRLFPLAQALEADAG